MPVNTETRTDPSVVCSDSVDPRRILQIDLLKALAITAVLIQHTALGFEPNDAVLRAVFDLSLYQGVPVFLVVLGLNAGLSFTRRGCKSLKEALSQAYLFRRFFRILCPFFMAFLLALFVGAIFFLKTGMDIIYIGPFTLIGFLPILGPGNFYVSIVLQSIVALPFLYVAYKKRPLVTIGSCFAISAIVTLVTVFQYPNQAAYAASDYYFSFAYVCILAYLATIALGIWLSDHFNERLERNHLVMLGAAVSACYIVIALSANVLNRLPVLEALTSFYPLLLVLLGIRYLPDRVTHGFVGRLAFLGRASYHIFLVQIIFFGVGGAGAWVALMTALHQPILNDTVLLISSSLASIAICIAAGVIFQQISNFLTVFILKMMNKHTVRENL